MERTVISNVGGVSGVASESTLLELYRAINKLGGNNDKLISDVGNLAKKKTTAVDDSGKKAKKEIDKASKTLEQSMYRFERGLGKVNSAFSGTTGLVKTGMEKPVTAMGSAVETVSGKIAGVSSYFGLLGKTLGGIVGIGGGLIGAFAAYMQNSIDSFQELSSVGANFGNDLLRMRKAALDGYMSLNEFSDIIKNNANLLSNLGDGVSQGAERFSRLSKNVREFDRNRLSTLGYSFGEINDVLANYLTIAGSGTSLQNKFNTNQRDLISGTVKYAQELNMLSALTGKNRKELAASVTEQIKRGDVQAALYLTQERYGKDVASNFASISAATTTLGPTFQNAFSELVAFPGFIKEGSQQILQYAGPLGKELYSLAQQVKDGSVNQEEATVRMIMAAKESRTFLAQRATFDEKAAAMYQQLTPLYAKFGDQTEAQIRDTVRREKTQAERSDQFGQGLMKLTNVFRMISARIEQAIIDNKLFDRLVEMADDLSNYLTGDKIKDAIEWLSDKIKVAANYISEAFTPEFWERMWIRIQDGFMWIVNGLKKLLLKIPMFETLTGMNKSDITRSEVFQTEQRKLGDAITKELEARKESISAEVDLKRLQSERDKLNVKEGRTPQESARLEELNDKLIPQQEELLKQKQEEHNATKRNTEAIREYVNELAKQDEILTKIAEEQAARNRLAELERTGQSLTKDRDAQAQTVANEQRQLRRTNLDHRVRAESERNIREATEKMRELDAKIEENKLLLRQTREVAERTTEPYKSPMQKLQEQADIEAQSGSVGGLPSRKFGGPTGSGGLFNLHAGEYVLSTDMIKDLNNMTGDIHSMLTDFESVNSLKDSIVKASMNSTATPETEAFEESKKNRRLQTKADFAPLEQDDSENIRLTKDILMEIKENNLELINLFKQHLLYAEEFTRDMADLKSVVEDNV